MNRESMAGPGRVVVWSLVGLMAVQGVAARYLLPYDLYLRVLAQFLSDYVPQAIRFRNEIPVTDALHPLLSVLMLVLGLLQFRAGFRARHPRLHRLIGRAFLILLLISVATGLSIGILYPFAGLPESVLMSVLSGVFLLLLTRAWLHARARRFALHREWMIRTLGLSLFVALQRVIGLPMAMLTDWPQRDVFLIAAGLGVLMTALASEWWIASTRSQTSATRSSAGAALS